MTRNVRWDVPKSELQQGIDFGLFIAAKQPHLVRNQMRNKPHKDDLFSQGVRIGIHQYKIRERRLRAQKLGQKELEHE